MLLGASSVMKALEAQEKFVYQRGHTTEKDFNF